MSSSTSLLDAHDLKSNPDMISALRPDLNNKSPYLCSFICKLCLRHYLFLEGQSKIPKGNDWNRSIYMWTIPLELNPITELAQNEITSSLIIVKLSTPIDGLHCKVLHYDSCPPCRQTTFTKF